MPPSRVKPTIFTERVRGQDFEQLRIQFCWWHHLTTWFIHLNCSNKCLLHCKRGHRIIKFAVFILCRRQHYQLVGQTHSTNSEMFGTHTIVKTYLSRRDDAADLINSIAKDQRNKTTLQENCHSIAPTQLPQKGISKASHTRGCELFSQFPTNLIQEQYWWPTRDSHDDNGQDKERRLKLLLSFYSSAHFATLTYVISNFHRCMNVRTGCRGSKVRKLQQVFSKAREKTARFMSFFNYVFSWRTDLHWLNQQNGHRREPASW